MKPPHEPQHPALARPGQPTSLAVAQAIEAMRDALFTAYGVDYSFQVTGRGALLGASTIHGVVEAVTTSAPSEGMLTLTDKRRGQITLTLRAGVVVGAMGSEPERFVGLTEARARRLAARGK